MARLDPTPQRVVPVQHVAAAAIGED